MTVLMWSLSQMGPTWGLGSGRAKGKEQKMTISEVCGPCRPLAVLPLCTSGCVHHSTMGGPRS